MWITWLVNKLKNVSDRLWKVQRFRRHTVVAHIPNPAARPLRSIRSGHSRGSRFACMAFCRALCRVELPNCLYYFINYLKMLFFFDFWMKILSIYIFWDCPRLIDCSIIYIYIYYGSTYWVKSSLSHALAKYELHQNKEKY